MKKTKIKEQTNKELASDRPTRKETKNNASLHPGVKNIKRSMLPIYAQ